MLTFFTDPYPNELLYSACARYHYYVGNIDYKDTLEELFGKRSIVPDLYFGSLLDTLVNHLGNSYSTDILIRANTLFPFYEPFLPEARRREIVEEMKKEGGSKLYAQLGISAGGICRKHDICYCYACAKEDIEKYGEPYIHREHQLQGVVVCPHHGVYLQAYTISRRNASRIAFIRLEQDKLVVEYKRIENKKVYEELYMLSKLAYRLLQCNRTTVNQQSLLHAYKKVLAQKGLVAINGRVRQQELYKEFVDFYSKQTLEILESNVVLEDEYNWLKVMTRNSKRTVHPIRHLLFINFLGEDLENLFQEAYKEYTPFGKGPWPCLNRSAKHYGEEVIESVTITPDYKTRMPVGTFKCSCGFIYSRKGPDKTLGDRSRIGRIKAFGDEWDNKLKEVLQQHKWGLRAIAREMSCDPKTILKKDIELGLYAFMAMNEECNQLEENGKTKVNQQGKCIEDCRLVVLQAIEANKSLARTQLRQLIKKEYIYLYRKDKEWLFEHLPMHTRKPIERTNVNWRERDAILLALIKQKCEELLRREKPVRITQSLIGKELGITSLLESKLYQLPKVGQYVEEVAETVQTFQLRRCKQIIDRKRVENETLELWQLQRLGGIRTAAFNNIKVELEKYMNT